MAEYIKMDPGCLCVCVCVCVSICLRLCVSSTALTAEPNLMKFYTDSFEDIGQCPFSQILKISIR